MTTLVEKRAAKREDVAQRTNCRRRDARTFLLCHAFLFPLGNASGVGLLTLLTFGSRRLAIGVALFIYLATVFLRIPALKRFPSVINFARRLEARSPRAAGSLVAALDPTLDGTPLADDALARAHALLNLYEKDKLPADELYALTCENVQPEAREQIVKDRRKLRAGWYLFVIAFVASLTCDAVCQNAPFRRETPQIVQTPPDPGANLSSSIAQPTRQTTPISPVDADGALESLETLAADLERALAIAQSLTLELQRDDFAPELAVELTRELESCVESPTGLVVRASAVARSAAATLRRTTPDESVPAFLAARRASELLAFFKGERARRAEMRAALSEILRAADAETKARSRQTTATIAGALQTRLTAETRAFSILDASWKFRAERAGDDVQNSSLRRAAASALASRAGLEPSERTATQSQEFFDALTALRNAWSDSLARYEETTRRLAAPESAEFLDFARRVADDAGLAETLWNADASGVFGYVEGELRLLDAARAEALGERWGRAATLLNAAPWYKSEKDDDSEIASLALRLTFGAIPPSALEDLAASVDDAPSRLARTLGAPDKARALDVLKMSDVDPETLRALEREAELSETAALEESAATPELRDEIADRDDRNVGGLASDRGAPDSGPAGAGAQDDQAAPRVFSGAEFHAELPDDARERVERAQKWNPPEEYLRRAEAFRASLWKELQKEKE